MAKYHRNGEYIITETHFDRFSSRWEGYVLAQNERTKTWVTWYFLVRDGEWDYNHGHYFDQERDARADFYHRISCMYA